MWNLCPPMEASRLTAYRRKGGPQVGGFGKGEPLIDSRVQPARRPLQRGRVRPLLERLLHSGRGWNMVPLGVHRSGKRKLRTHHRPTHELGRWQLRRARQTVHLSETSLRRNVSAVPSHATQGPVFGLLAVPAPRRQGSGRYQQRWRTRPARSRNAMTSQDFEGYVQES